MAHTRRPGDIPIVCIFTSFSSGRVTRRTMAFTVHMSLPTHITARCSICLFGVCLCCFPVLTWTNLSACGCLLAPQGGITLTTRASRTPHHTLSSSHNLVRAPRPLCRCRPPHDSHMMQRLKVLCPAHRPRSVLPIHRFGWAPPALSQMTFWQLRSLRLPRSSLLLPFWSVASLLTRPRRPSYQPPHHLRMPIRRLSHTPLPFGTLLRNSRSGSSWLHLLLLTLAALHVLHQFPRYLLTRLCRRLYTASQLPLTLSHKTSLRNSRSRSSLSDASTRTIPRGALAPPSSHDVLCPTCSRPVPSLLLDAAAQTPLYSVESHDASTQLPPSSSGAPSPTTLETAKPRIGTLQCWQRLTFTLILLRFAVPAEPATPATVRRTLRPHVCHHSRLRVSSSLPASAPHVVYLLKRPGCDLVCIHPSQSRPHSHMSVPPQWEHIMRAQPLPAREVLVLPWRGPTILSIQILVQGMTLSLNGGSSFFLWSTLVNPNLKGTVVLMQPTVISCIINFVFPSFNGIQTPRAEILLTLSPLPVVGIMQLFFKKPVITYRTSLPCVHRQYGPCYLAQKRHL